MVPQKTKKLSEVCIPPQKNIFLSAGGVFLQSASRPAVPRGESKTYTGVKGAFLDICPGPGLEINSVGQTRLPNYKPKHISTTYYVYCCCPLQRPESNRVPSGSMTCLTCGSYLGYIEYAYEKSAHVLICRKCEEENNVRQSSACQPDRTIPLPHCCT